MSRHRIDAAVSALFKPCAYHLAARFKRIFHHLKQRCALDLFTGILRSHSVEDRVNFAAVDDFAGFINMSHVLPKAGLKKERGINASVGVNYVPICDSASSLQPKTLLARLLV